MRFIGRFLCYIEWVFWAGFWVGLLPTLQHLGMMHTGRKMQKLQAIFNPHTKKP
jgi:hypothetical protein